MNAINYQRWVFFSCSSCDHSDGFHSPAATSFYAARRKDRQHLRKRLSSQQPEAGISFGLQSSTPR